jgi:hypothetical protein
MKRYDDDRPAWCGPVHSQYAKWRGMLLEVRRLDNRVIDDWEVEQWRFRVTGGDILSKYSNVVEFEDDAKHCAEGAARDYSTGAPRGR